MESYSIGSVSGKLTQRHISRVTNKAVPRPLYVFLSEVGDIYTAVPPGLILYTSLGEAGAIAFPCTHALSLAYISVNVGISCCPPYLYYINDDGILSYSFVFHWFCCGLILSL